MFKWCYLTQLRKVAGNKKECKNIKGNFFFPGVYFQAARERVTELLQ